MPFHRSVFGAVSSGLSSLGGFLGDVFTGGREAIFPTLPGVQQVDPGFIGPPAPVLPGGAQPSIGERLGGFLVERVAPFLFPVRVPNTEGGTVLTTIPVGGRRNIVPSIPETPGTMGAIPVVPSTRGTSIAPPLPIPIGPARIRAGLGGEEPMAAALALPGGAAILRQVPGILAGLGLGEIFGGGGNGDVDLPFGGRFFHVPTGVGVRARSLVRLTNPATGADVWYRNVGQPILFRGDFATVRRVRKIASLAHRRIGHRRGR